MNNCILVDLLRENYYPGKVMLDLNDYIKECQEQKHIPCALSDKEISDLMQDPKTLWNIIDAIYNRELSPEEFKERYDGQSDKKKAFMTDFFKYEIEKIAYLPFEPFASKEDIINLYGIAKGFTYKEEKMNDTFKVTIRIESNFETSFTILPEKGEISALNVVNLIIATVDNWKDYQNLIGCKPFSVYLDE